MQSQKTTPSSVLACYDKIHLNGRLLARNVFLLPSTALKLNEEFIEDGLPFRFIRKQQLDLGLKR